MGDIGICEYCGGKMASAVNVGDFECNECGSKLLKSGERETGRTAGDIKNYVGNSCVKGHTLEMLKSPAGLYIGTLDSDGTHNCRISGYCQSKKDIFKERVCEENKFCSNNSSCIQFIL